jgi:protein arginine N-methyltransferase 1
MYSLEGYGKMLADTVRLDAYVEALRRSVKPGSVVLDLGAGPGLFSLYACRLGARRVYAVEPDDSIQLARELAKANGYSGRIVTIQDLSFNVQLPEPADVIVADLRGILPFYCKSIAAMMDARDRLLAPGGVLIPQQDTIHGTVAESPDLYNRRILAWGQTGFDMSAARLKAVNTMYKIRTTPEEFLAGPCPIGSIDYRTVASPHFEASACWRAARSGTAHGLCVWFESALADGVSFSNAPGLPELTYGAAFFPFPEPSAVEPGDRIAVKIQADPVGDDYIWRWNTSIETGDAGGRDKRFSQSTFYATLLTRKSLQAATPGSGPGVTACGT